MNLVLLLLCALMSFTCWGDDVIISKVLVYKQKRILQLLDGDRVHKQYTISLGDNPIGHKQQEGDERTPEGNYVIDYRNRHSRFHRSLHISYPNAADIASAKKRGVKPGGLIMIHGLPNGFAWTGNALKLGDWTDGCIAVNNKEIEEIWALVKDGTPITIYP